MKKQSVALLCVAIMALSVCTAINLTTATKAAVGARLPKGDPWKSAPPSLAVAKKSTQTTIASTNYKPVRGQAITLTCSVKVPNWVIGSAFGLTQGDVIKIYRRVADGKGGWTAWKEYKKTTLAVVAKKGPAGPVLLGGFARTTAYGYTLNTQFKAVYQGNARLFTSESTPITIAGYGVS